MANNIYFNSRAKALEAKLLSFETLTDLANSQSVFEITKILNSNLYLKGQNPQTFSDLLQIVLNEQKEFLKFLKMETPNPDISNFFCVRFDYFNLECLFLQTKLAKTFSFLPEGTMLISTLQKAVENEQTQKMLPPEMQNALKKANNLFLQQKQTGFLVDTIFKKAQYEHMMRLSRADKALHSYFLSFVDLKNIELCFRFRDKNIFESTRLLGGTLENNFFEMLCEKPLETILLKTANSPYFSAIKLLANAFENGKPFSQFEFLVDCFGVTFFDEFKFNTNKNYAYLRYCFLKQNELTNLRIIFEGLQAKRSHKKICEDLRRVYAK